MYSSAAEAGKSMAEAIGVATRRAKEGLLGACDFALLMVAGFSREKGNPAEHLTGVLGLEVPVIGCWSEGVMGLDESGEPMEHIRQLRRGPGAVAVVLGRVPGVAPVAFAGNQPPKPRGVHNKMELPLSATPWPQLQEALAAGAAMHVSQLRRASERRRQQERWRQQMELQAPLGGFAAADGRQPGRNPGGGLLEEEEASEADLMAAEVLESVQHQRQHQRQPQPKDAHHQPGAAAAEPAALRPMLLILFVNPTDVGVEVADLALEWMATHLPNCPVAGGIAGSQTGGPLIMRPGPDMPATKGRHHSQYAGLALCVPVSPSGCRADGGGQGTSTKGALGAVGDFGALSSLSPPVSPPTASSSSSAAAAVAAAAAAAAAEVLAASAAPAGPEDHEPLASQQVTMDWCPLASTPARGAAPASREACGQLASVLSFQGLRGGDNEPVWGISAVHGSQVPNIESDDFDSIFINRVSRATIYPPDRGSSRAGGRGNGAAGEARPGPQLAMHGTSRDMADMSTSLSYDTPVGMWRRRPGEPPARAASDDPGQELLVLHPGGVMMLEGGGSLGEGIGLALDNTAMGPEGLAAVRAMLNPQEGEAAAGELCLQNLNYDAASSERILVRELPHLVSSLPRVPDQDGCMEMAAGPSSGPLLLLDLSCSGRGISLYGRAGVEPAAMRTAVPRGAALAGCFLNGEIGPAVRGGAAGWQGAGAIGTARGGRRAAPTLRQTFTSVLVGVGSVASPLAPVGSKAGL